MSLAWKGIVTARVLVPLERVLEEKAFSEIAFLARISGSMDKAWQVCPTHWRFFRVPEFSERATMLAFLVQAGPDEVVYSPPDHAAIRRWRKRSSFPSRCRPPMSPLARPRAGTLHRGYPGSVPPVTCWH
jgi:hypothetical protein